MSELKYGPVKGEENAVKIPFNITTGETFRAKSGRFVTLNSGYLEVADAGDTLLAGWLEIGNGVTVAGQQGSLILAENCNTVFRVPILGSTDLTEAMLGKTCDLVRETVDGVTLVQGVDLGASGEDVVKIVGRDNSVAVGSSEWVDVIFVPAKVTAGTGVA